MYPVSARFNETIFASHQVVVQCQVLDENNDVIATFTPSKGSIKTSNSTTRRSVSGLVVFDPLRQYTPADAKDIFFPSGRQIRLFRGIRYASDGVEELVPLGTFHLSVAEVMDNPTSGLAISLTAYDRSRKISRNKTQRPIRFVGVSAGQVISSIIESQAPWLPLSQLHIDGGPLIQNATLPPIIVRAGHDPWALIKQISLEIGAEAFFDVSGNLVIAPKIDPNSVDPVMQFVEGDGNGMVSLTRRFDDSMVVNQVVVVGRGAYNLKKPPIMGIAEDTNPNSPTQIATYGVVNKVYHFVLITSPTQAQQTASSILINSLGITDSIQFTAMVHPALDINDVVHVRRAASRLNNNYAILGLDIPLEITGSMQATTRATTVGN